MCDAPILRTQRRGEGATLNCEVPSARDASGARMAAAWNEVVVGVNDDSDQSGDDDEEEASMHSAGQIEQKPKIRWSDTQRDLCNTPARLQLNGTVERRRDSAFSGLVDSSKLKSDERRNPTSKIQIQHRFYGKLIVRLFFFFSLLTLIAVGSTNAHK